MKEGIHPNYREVLFVDLSNGFKFVTRSCVNTKEMGKTDDGRELPMFKLDTSSESHPFLHRYAKVRGQHGWPRGALPQPFRQDCSQVIRRISAKKAARATALPFCLVCPYSRQSAIAPSSDA
jgi:ribosomal protein L31